MLIGLVHFEVLQKSSAALLCYFCFIFSMIRMQNCSYVSCISHLLTSCLFRPSVQKQVSWPSENVGWRSPMRTSRSPKKMFCIKSRRALLKASIFNLSPLFTSMFICECCARSRVHIWLKLTHAFVSQFVFYYCDQKINTRAVSERFDWFVPFLLALRRWFISI